MTERVHVYEYISSKAVRIYVTLWAVSPSVPQSPKPKREAPAERKGSGARRLVAGAAVSGAASDQTSVSSVSHDFQ